MSQEIIEFKKNIKKVMKTLKISQIEAAVELDLSVSMISRYLQEDDKTNRRVNPVFYSDLLKFLNEKSKERRMLNKKYIKELFEIFNKLFEIKSNLRLIKSYRVQKIQKLENKDEM